MVKNNPSNPYTRDDTKTQKDVPMPISKATVLSAVSRRDGYHAARIKVHGDEAPYDAPVLPFTIGSAHIPKPDTNVAVLFGPDDKPWIIGPWYADDAVKDGKIDSPEYEAGEVVVGNHTGSHIRIDNDGDVHINSEGGNVYINGTKQ
jgi:hypothetical protein